MRIAISGLGGLVGSALGADLAAAGHTVVPISRGTVPGDGHIAWDGAATIDTARLRGCDAVVHLAGAGIADRRWSAARMRELRDSRILGTTAIATSLAADPGSVVTFVCASASGFYGDRGDEELSVGSAPGTGFLADLCRDWEAATDPCRDRVRTVNLRLGVVLAAQGGALARMLPPARLGLSGRLGSGQQWWPWIHRDDLVAVIRHALTTPSLAGPVDAVAGAVRQRVLAQALATAVGRWALGPPAPRFLLRLALGQMADEVLLASARVVPRQLAAGGFTWRHPDLGGALRSVAGA